MTEMIKSGTVFVPKEFDTENAPRAWNTRTGAFEKCILWDKKCIFAARADPKKANSQGLCFNVHGMRKSAEKESTTKMKELRSLKEQIKSRLKKQFEKSEQEQTATQGRERELKGSLREEQRQASEQHTKANWARQEHTWTRAEQNYKRHFFQNEHSLRQLSRPGTVKNAENKQKAKEKQAKVKKYKSKWRKTKTENNKGREVNQKSATKYE